MSTVGAAQSYNDGLEELLDSTRYQKYLQAVSYFPHYSYKNIMRILEQMPHATNKPFETRMLWFVRGLLSLAQ